MLWEAAYRGRLSVVRFLVDAGASLEAFGSHYTPHLVDISPYCVAAFHGRGAVAEYLVSRGAERSVHTAAYLDDVRLLEELLEDDAGLISAVHVQTHWRGGKVWPEYHEYRPVEWATPLVYAFAGGSAEAAEFLLERGGQVGPVRERLVEYADHRGDRAPRLRDLIAAALGEPASSLFSADPEPGDLVYLCRGDRGGDPDEVRRLLARGADVHERNDRGQTPLHNAARGGLVPAMKVLLAHGADPNARDGRGQTPLHAVIRAKVRRRERLQAAMVLLLDAGGDPRLADEGGSEVIELMRASKVDDWSALLSRLSARP